MVDVKENQGRVCPKCGAEGKGIDGAHDTTVRKAKTDNTSVFDVGWRCWNCGYEWGFEFCEPDESPT